MTDTGQDGSPVPISPDNVTPSASNEVTPTKTRTGKVMWVTGVMLGIICILGAAWWQQRTLPSPSSDIVKNETIPTATTTVKSITFNGEEFAVGDTLPQSQGTDYISESYERVRSTETLDTWTKLITIHKLSPLDATKPLDAASYAQNVADLQTKNGALLLETSLINQDMEALGVDPAYPPYLLVYIYTQGDVSEFDMQKIQMLPNGSIGSIIYAERFTTKSEADMKTFYNSKGRTDKRAELIRMKFPYLEI